MKILQSVYALSILFISSICHAQSGYNEKIWMTYSGDTSKNWESQVFHLGNGYFGASCYGGAKQEIFTLAEKTFWTGGPGDASENNYGIIPSDKNLLHKVKQYTAEGNINEVDKIAYIFNSEAFTSKWNSAFSCIGKLQLDFKNTGEVSDYTRTLDLNKSVVTIKYKIDGVNYTREYFCSYPNRVLAMRIIADKPAAINCNLKINLYHTKRNPQTLINEKNGEYTVHGNIDDNNRPYVVRIKLINEGGKLYKDGGKLCASESNAITIYYTVATNYVLQAPLYKGANPEKITAECIANSVKSGYAELRKSHINDYQGLYNRTKLTLENPAANRIHLPTNERLNYYILQQNYEDLGLKELAFNFGKYMLISLSRPHTQMPGLYGLWNDRYAARWNGVIQQDMNNTQTYMFGNALNLSECQQPIIGYTRDKAISGERMAKEYFDSKGWMAGMVGDIWGGVGMLSGNTLRFNSTGWLALILYEQYAFDRNAQYLKEIYPVLKGAAQSYMDNLVQYKDTKKLVPFGFASAEHCSPEGNLMPNYQDIAFAAETFENTARAAHDLGIDDDFQKKLLETKDRLMPYKIGRWGQFQEWVEDLDDTNCQHRHISHLLGLQPCHQINVLKNPEYIDAIKRTLNSRGDADFLTLHHPEMGNSDKFPSKCTHEGYHFDNFTSQVWCRAARICSWLRIFEGNRADKIYNDIFRESTLENMMQYETMAHYEGPGESTATPCFPDGVILSAGYVTEMVLQSQNGELHFLPALPDAWKTGSLTGIRARGGYSVDIYWKDGKLTNAVIKADNTATCPLRYNGKTKEVTIQNGKPLVITGSDFSVN